MNQNNSADSGESTQPIQSSPNTNPYLGLGQIANGGNQSDVTGDPRRESTEPYDRSQMNFTMSDVTWRDEYEKSQKKVKILTGTTAAACVLALVAGVWGIAKSSGPQVPDFASGQQLNQGSGPGGQGGPGGMGGMGGQGGPGQMLTELFNSDGSVNTEQLNQLMSNMPDGIDPTNMIDRAEQSGALTSDQATKLKDAMANMSSSDTDNTSDSNTERDWLEDSDSNTGSTGTESL